MKVNLILKQIEIDGENRWFFGCDFEGHFKVHGPLKSIEQELPKILKDTADFMNKKLEGNYKGKIALH